jgi:Mlc titration factor MtfA (ptsG expression regulator)
MLSAWRRWRDQRTLAQRPIPDALWQQTLLRFPFLDHLPDTDAARLRELSTLFLARKEFTGAHGLQVTDEMAVAIAAQACLPILHLGLAWYDAFVGIVVHADEVVAQREEVDEDGVVHQFEEPLTGEAMGGGPVTLSWRDVAGAGESADWGYNVVIHEFAHVLDMRDGLEPDGIPPLPDRAARQAWQDTLDAEYTRFCDRLDAGEDTLIDPYGGTAPSEFFAVACEVFFVAPADLQTEHEPVYRLLKEFFQQDPSLRAPAPLE